MSEAQAATPNVKLLTPEEWAALSPESRHCLNLWQLRIEAMYNVVAAAYKLTGNRLPFLIDGKEFTAQEIGTLREAMNAYIAAALAENQETR